MNKAFSLRSAARITSDFILFLPQKEYFYIMQPAPNFQLDPENHPHSYGSLQEFFFNYLSKQ